MSSYHDGLTGVIFDVVTERKAQDAKFGVQDITDFEFLAVLVEEVGEVAQAVLQTRFGGSHAGTTRHELVHAAAVAISFIQCIDRRDKTSHSVPQPELEIGQVDK